MAALAALGFAMGSTEKILLAGALALPFSFLAAVAFYGAVGLLGLVPGANPSESSGSSSCSADNVCTSSSTGDSAAWWLFTTDVLGVVALAAAAIANVVMLRCWLSFARDRAQARAQRRTP